MLRQIRKLCVRMIALTMAVCLISTDALAIVKEVSVWGAQSINNLGQSDNASSLEELKDDYSDYTQTDGLREYFYSETDEAYKEDLSEALSWLIDNEIIIRDETVTVSGVDDESVPMVNITMKSTEELESAFVTRSDAIMYIYKAVFGPIDARTVGVETVNVRYDDGVRDTLINIMEAHDYLATVTMDSYGGIVQGETSGGDEGTAGYVILTPLGWIPYAGDGGSGGSSSSVAGVTNIVNGETAGSTVVAGRGLKGSQGTTGSGLVNAGDGGSGASSAGGQYVTSAINTSALWHYTPQGAYYESMFGDTNIFIGDTVIDQDVNTSGGSSTGGQIDINEGAAITDGDDSLHAGSATTSQNNNSGQIANGGGGGGGGANAAIQVETDYKTIFYVPAADLMFYRVNDCLELYLRSAMNKGLLTDDEELRTDLFKQTIMSGSTDTTQLESWSPNAPAYIVNRITSRLNADDTAVKTAVMAKVLGVNYNISFENDTFTVQRNNLFENQSGYFSTEQFYKMDAYRYIYRFVYSNEKAISDLEADIVSYKFGMDLDSCVRNDEDLQIIEYLIAKGILNFDTTDDFENLYCPITYEDFIPILYRAANKEARLDFSVVQLTDSESNWKAKGYAPQTMYIVADDAPQAVYFVPNDLYGTSPDEEDSETISTSSEYYSSQGTSLEDSSYTIENGTPVYSVSYDEEGNISNTNVSAEDLLNRVDTQTIDVDSGVQWVQLGAGSELGKVEGQQSVGSAYFATGYNFDFHGATLGNGASYNIDAVLKDYFTKIEAMNITDNEEMGGFTGKDLEIVTDGTWDVENNPCHAFQKYFLFNMWVICYTSTQDCWSKIEKVLEEKIGDGATYNKEEMNNKKVNYGVESTYKDRVLCTFYYSLESSMKEYMFGDGAPKNIKISIKNTTSASGNITEVKKPCMSTGSSVTYPGGDAQAINFAQYLYYVSFTMQDQSKTKYWYAKFAPASVGSNLGNVEAFNTINNSTITIGIVINDEGVEVTDASTAASAAEDYLTGLLGSTSVAEAKAEGNGITTQTNRYNSFWSWSELSRLMNQANSGESCINLTQVSELILQNNDTNTKALFRTEDPKIALVGTTIVTGDETYGVAFKEGSGASQTCYYHDNAIRLLINAKQESMIVSGSKVTTVPDQAFLDSLTDVPLQSATGHSESCLTGVTVLLAREGDGTVVNTGTSSSGSGSGSEAGSSSSATATTTVDKITWEDVSALYERNTSEKVLKLFKATDDKSIWGEYLSLSTSNMAANVISRRITYTNTATNSESVAYAVVIYRPVDISGYTTASVTANSSMQDLMDAVVSPPTNDADKAVYDSNMALSNAFANWIYGTTGGDYIETGFVKPEAYLFYADTSGTAAMPASVLSPLTDEQASYIVQEPLNTKSNGDSIAVGGRCKDYADIVANSPYMLSSSYKALVYGDRIYLNAGIYPNLVRKSFGDSIYYCVSNNYASSHSFVVGSTFKLRGQQGWMADNASDWKVEPEATVISTSSDGTVTCQYGPIVGVPLHYGTSEIVLTYLKEQDNVISTLAAKGWDKYSGNRMNIVKSLLSGLGLTYGGIYDSPSVSLTGNNVARLISDGENIIVYPSSGDSSDIVTVKMPDFSTNGNSAKTVKEAVEFQDTKIKSKYSGSIPYTSNAYTYITFTFDASKYHLVSGYLERGTTTASDYIDPFLFSNLNDLLINSMINESNGAIAVNEIPEGSLLKVGENWFCAVGTSTDDKAFVGYTYLTANTSAVYRPTLQDAAKTFANHFILGGNQYINVSHYFSEFEMITQGDMTTYKNPLDIISNATFTTSEDFYNIDPDGNATVIKKGTGTSGTKIYTVTKITFQNLLSAYPAQSLGSGDNKVQGYYLCNMAENAISGAFSDLSIWTDDVLDAKLLDVTVDLATASYSPNNKAESLFNSIVETFRAGFNGDLFTLFRLILFVIIIWLITASWVCFGFYHGNLMPIIDAIKNPSRNGPGSGIDLFKIISLGTISTETDFKLGKFIQYNAVLCLLLLIVWKSGSIVI